MYLLDYWKKKSEKKEQFSISNKSILKDISSATPKFSSTMSFKISIWCYTNSYAINLNVCSLDTIPIITSLIEWHFLLIKFRRINIRFFVSKVITTIRLLNFQANLFFTSLTTENCVPRNTVIRYQKLHNRSVPEEIIGKWEFNR